MKVLKMVGRCPEKTDKEHYTVKSAQFYNNSFHNEKDIVLMSGKGYPLSARRKPKKMISAMPPTFFSDASDDDLAFTWFGHSSFLLQAGKVNILIDPVLSMISSPVSFAGPKRFSEIPVSSEQMPEIDVLFLSHDHYDHMDYNSIRNLDPKVGKYIVPLGVDSILKGWGIEKDKIYALDWWEGIEINSIVYTVTPSQHFAGRNPLKRNCTLWGGIYIDNGIHKIYYTGDGGYCDVFRKINEKFGPPELMIAECGQYDPSWSFVHMFPEEVVQAAIDLDTSWMIPVHWGAFCICNHAWDDSIIRVTKAAKESRICMSTPRIGETVNFADIGSYNEPWWTAYE